MAKIFKVFGYFVDPNGDFNEDDVEVFLESMDLIAKGIKVEEEDIGEWDENLPINKIDCDLAECEKYFRK